MVESFFPIIIITLSALAGVVYISKGMLWPAVYWLCAAALNIAALKMAG